MLPYLIAGAIGFGIGKLFEEGGETFMAGGNTGDVKVKSIKKKAEKLLEESISYRWINTDMGSGWRFQLESPSNRSVFNVIEQHTYIDEFSPEDAGIEWWDDLSDEDKEYYYEEWKEGLLQGAFQRFKEKCMKHLDDFIEYLQRDSDEDFYAGGGEITDADLNYYIYPTKKVNIAYLGKIQMGNFFSLKDALKEIEYLTMAYPKNEIEKYAIITPDKTFHLGEKEYNIRFDNGGDVYDNSPILAVRNYDADYFVNESGDLDDNGTIKRYAIEIQSVPSGDVIEYTSAYSEKEASEMIKKINATQKVYAGGGEVSAKLKKLKSEMKQIWEEIGEQYSDKKEMLMSAGYDGSEANDLKHEEWKYLGNDVQIKLINDYFGYYEKLAVYVQGVGSIYNGTSMQSAVNKANSYLKNNPKAEIVISDEKYGDTYDLDGYKIDEEYAGGGVAKKRRRSASIQYGRSDTAVDKTRVAKPVGYRFTNAKASELRKDPYAKPTEAQIKKYLGKGIYKENRKRHSDKDRNAKL